MARKSGPGRGHRLPYKQKVVGLKVHPNVDVLLGELAEQAGMNRNAFFTALLAEKAGKTLAEILVPDNNQEVLPETA